MATAEHRAQIEWTRAGATFTDQRYSRAHRWRFDGGLEVGASASPHNVALAHCDPSAIDPEEALLAATSSCHMLWFLYFAAKQGLIVDRYEDDVRASIERDERGRMAFRVIELRPQIDWAGEPPSDAVIDALHERAHEECFIANSLRAEVKIAR